MDDQKENVENEHHDCIATTANINSDDAAKLLTPISNAISLSLEKKCRKMLIFLDRHMDNLEAHLQHLCGFALSSGGLIKDEYRERIWPILAKNLPQTEKYSNVSIYSNDEAESSPPGTPKKFKFMENIVHVANPESSNTDSDFESALSNLSSSALAGDDEEPMLDVDEDAETAHSSPIPNITLEELQSHPEWRQVELDVARTLARFPPGIEEESREILQEQLTKLIVQVLFENPDFHYYQGFHDVCLTFLLVLGDVNALRAVKVVCQRGAFHNYLSCPLDESVLRELDNLYPLLYLHDHEIERRMRDVELGTLFALSWPLTWFSHALQNYSQVVLFFDFLLCSHHLMPIYISAALICERREEILECEHEMPYLHKLLNEVPSDINCRRILDTARALFSRYPPILLEELKKEYVKICERQRRQRSAIENLELTQIRNTRQQLLMRRGSLQLRQNIYEIVRPVVVAGGMAALAFACYYAQKNTMFPP